VTARQTVSNLRRGATSGAAHRDLAATSFNPHPTIRQDATVLHPLIVVAIFNKVSILIPPSGRMQHRRDDGWRIGCLVSILIPPSGRMQRRGFAASGRAKRGRERGCRREVRIRVRRAAGWLAFPRLDAVFQPREPAAF